MQTILYQGRPGEGDTWMALPDHCVATYIALGYQTRELVLREDAEKAVRDALAKVPDGFKLVPVEPTPLMCKGAINAADHRDVAMDSNDARVVYRAMLDEAPAPRTGVAS